MSEDHQHAYYQAGAVIHRKIVRITGDDWTTDVKDTWHDTQNNAGTKLEYSFTPAVDGFVLANAKASMSFSEANASSGVRLFEHISSVAIDETVNPSPLSGALLSCSSTGIYEFTANTQVFIKAQVAFSTTNTAMTMTVRCTVEDYDGLFLIFFRAP